MSETDVDIIIGKITRKLSLEEKDLPTIICSRIKLIVLSFMKGKHH